MKKKLPKVMIEIAAVINYKKSEGSVTLDAITVEHDNEGDITLTMEPNAIISFPTLKLVSKLCEQFNCSYYVHSDKNRDGVGTINYIHIHQ